MEIGTVTIKVLEKVGEDIAVKTGPTFDLKEYFKTRPGLYVFSDFPERILSKAEPVEAGTEYKIVSYKTVIDAKDELIESALPEKHLFSESEVCAIIADLINKQPKGEDGVLLNDGYWNLFYTPAFVVGVHWYGDAWRVYAWNRVDGAWSSGSRVFSPAN